ncbi:hypothetical protein CALCODRAFT_505133 [Calocera cornea HHB12733]|uniref:Uncharacterized protein n=1 Tax=Calocera cornea HHB12733 TaxID=1353952 RepID=A0A165C049_9BASI|nr:hypothetical protein CALCODRAFT_505133 [Calocera cornea HHB12733]
MPCLNSPLNQRLWRPGSSHPPRPILPLLLCGVLACSDLPSHPFCFFVPGEPRSPLRPALVQVGQASPATPL